MRRVYNKHHGDAPADSIYVGRPSEWGTLEGCAPNPCGTAHQWNEPSMASIDPASDTSGSRRDQLATLITKSAFARNLARSRTEQGKTQKHLAIALNVSPGTYSRWENVDDFLLPSFEKLKELAIELRISTDILIGIDDLSVEDRRIVALLRVMTLSDRDYVIKLIERLSKGR